jgi:hypothetical protein
MKKVILEEIENMKYLLGYKRGVVISEQEAGKDDLIDKYSSKSIANQIDSGNYGNLDPKAAEAIKVAQSMVGGSKPGVEVGGITGANAGTTPPAGTQPPAGTTPPATTTTTPVTPIKIGVKYPSVEELQNSLNTKFKSGLTPDGKYGPKTSASILAALQQAPASSTETNTPPNIVVGDPNSEVAKKTAETNAPVNGDANNETNKNTPPVASNTNFAEVDGNEYF